MTTPADSTLDKDRLRALSEELRCLVCQNQSLADSNAELAVDLKREVEKLMRQGKTNDEIKAYLVQRYGDFVLYKPPMQSNTAALWAGPFVLLAGGALAWKILQRRSAAQVLQSSATPASNSAADKTAAKLLD